MEGYRSEGGGRSDGGIREERKTGGEGEKSSEERRLDSVQPPFLVSGV